MIKKLKVFEAFAWYWWASFWLKKSGIDFEVVGYSEIDKYASEIFELNHPNIKNYWDITQIDPNLLPDFDMFTWWFPCQPFSSAWLGNWELDIRWTLFYDVIRICKIKKPKHVFLENVKWITTIRHKDTFNKIQEELKKIWYSVKWKLLNTKDYWVPQNRERVWIYWYLWELPNDFTIEPEKTDKKIHLKDFLDKKPTQDLFLNDKQIKRLEELHKVDFNIKESLCLDVYNKKIRHDWTSITITEPHHNSLRIVHPPKNGKYIVRKLSITEHYRLMWFNNWEFNFGDFSYQQICKRAWNWWDVNLVSKILKHIFNQLK